METNILVPILSVLIVLILVGLTVWFGFKSLRTRKRPDKPGLASGEDTSSFDDWRPSEESLIERERTDNRLELYPLNLGEKIRYQGEWIDNQADFVDKPDKAVDEADRLTTEIMIMRGFPVADFEKRIADLAEVYPDISSDYRRGHEIAMKNQDGKASTEELREAMVCYRNVIEHLLETEESDIKEAAY